MEKTEVIDQLKKAGYQVQFDSSVVTVFLPPEVNRSQELKRIRNMFSQMGYRSSFGIRQTMNVDKISSSEESILTCAKEKKETTKIKTGHQYSLKDFGIK